ncbi:hypothetical protein [Chryseobacterium nepalense]|uniref:CdiA C-terminal domain-containing protein n=1 Tax=Chryseobacterium nepalense TaxID=1854498 RepID=UPI003D11AEC7
MFCWKCEGRTSDLLINGISYDVYTPETSNISSIVRAIRNKNTQCNGVVLDLSKTSIKALDLGNLLKRVQGAGAKNINDIVIMPK